MNREKKKDKGWLLMVIAVLLGIEAGWSQTLPREGILYWPANPESEGVEWYTVEWFNGSRGEWLLIDNTSFCQPRSEFQSSFGLSADNLQGDSFCSLIFDIGSLNIDIREGLEICLHVIANKPGQQSEPSNDACATITVGAGVTIPEQPAPTSISQPLTPRLEFR